ncbi:MAG: hypothetical protein QOD09_3120 [Bradyrhizobium sp.]|nr:hypothetical protein [Bradyrhizobium sp.]
MGSFTDYEAANKLVSATLLRNRERVDCLVEGKSSKDEVDATFDSPTGKEAFAPDELTDPQIRQTYGVRVVIVADHRTPRGYRVHTAFPRNFHASAAPSKYRMDIYRSTGVEVTYDWRTADNFAQATLFLKDLAGGPTSVDPGNPDKPRFYYFEAKRQDEGLDAFIHRLRRGSP